MADSKDGRALREPALLASLPEPASGLGPTGDDPARGGPWPLCGYAPGGYTGRCHTCGKRAEDVDKRAYQCLECAAASANALIADLAEARRAVKAAEAERDEADRRAGAAERRLADLQDSRFKLDRWLAQAKADAGYHRNVSFDRVWADALAALKASRDRDGGSAGDPERGSTAKQCQPGPERSEGIAQLPDGDSNAR